MPIPAKKVLLFSTLNPYPFWAGSENLWYDFVSDERVRTSLPFRVQLADSPATRKKAAGLQAGGTEVGFYKHFNINFAARNLSRMRDKITGKVHRTLPWYDEIKKGSYQLVWFNVAALADLADLFYATEICRQRGVPYWLLLQHGAEEFFCGSEEELGAVTAVATGAKRFVFIAERNRRSLERALGQELTNAFHTVNAIPDLRIREAMKLGQGNPVKQEGRAKFFNLGRFSPRDKAQHLLLEAFRGVQWKNRDWELNFIGVSGFGESYLKSLVRYYGLEPTRIHILPHTESVLEEIVKQDVLLMPSLAEGTPFAMIESMACGRPALGTPIGGIPELITDKKTGWLCSNTSSEAVAGKLEEAWEQRNEWNRMGQAAQEHINQHYNQQTTFTELLRVINADSN